MEFEKLKDIIVDVMGCNPDEITMDTTFVDDLGADSLDIFQIIMGVKMHLISKLKMKMQKRSQQ